MKSFTGNLNLSILELLSVILPGAAGLYFLSKIDYLQHWIGSELKGAEEWIAGLVYFGLAYFLGYVLYVVSSPLDGWYDRIKRKALRMDTEEGRREGLRLLPVQGYRIKNPLFRLLFPHLVDTHNLIVKTVALKNRDLSTDLDGYRHQTIDAFQYAFRRLMAQQPAMFAEVERYHATARFFRCMTLVLFLGATLWLCVEPEKLPAFILYFLSLVSLLVFFNRWRKTYHVAMKNVLVLESFYLVD